MFWRLVQKAFVMARQPCLPYHFFNILSSGHHPPLGQFLMQQGEGEAEAHPWDPLRKPCSRCKPCACAGEGEQGLVACRLLWPKCEGYLTFWL